VVGAFELLITTVDVDAQIADERLRGAIPIRSLIGWSSLGGEATD
jgi:hypothetical protein